MIRSTSFITLTAVVLLLASSSSTSVIVQAAPITVSRTFNYNPDASTVSTTIKRDETSGAAPVSSLVAPVAPAVGTITQQADDAAGFFKGLPGHFVNLAENTATGSDVANPSTNLNIPQDASNAITKPLQNAGQIATKPLQNVGKIAEGTSTTGTTTGPVEAKAVKRSA